MESKGKRISGLRNHTNFLQLPEATYEIEQMNPTLNAHEDDNMVEEKGNCLTFTTRFASSL